MKDPNSTSIPIIDSTEAAEFLLDYATQQIIHPFMGKEASLSEAADVLGVSINALHYRVQKLQSWEILRVTQERKRKGRAIKMYEATSTRFFIPFGATRAETLERYLKDAKRFFENQLTQCIANILQHSDQNWGIKVFLNEDGVMNTKLASYPDMQIDFNQTNPALLDFYIPSLHLDAEDAHTLKEELSTLVQKYAKKEGKTPYIMHIGLAPLMKP